VSRVALVELTRRRPRRREAEKVTLVTGGAGFVGTNLADELLRRGERVRILDNLSRRNVDENLRWLQERHGDRVEFAPVDIRDRHGLRGAVDGVGSVFHLAAQVAVTTSIEDPIADFEVNLAGTVALLDELRRLPEPPSVVFTSTNKVYGTLPDVELERVHERWLPSERRLRERGIDESQPLDFCTPYGCSKGGADQYVLDWTKSYGIPATVLRMSCIYGPHQHGNEDQGWLAHFAIRALAGEPVTIYGDGAQVRDVLFVEDLVRAFLLVRGLGGEVFNVGGGPDNAISLLELLDLLENLDGLRPEVRFAEERLGDQRWYVSDWTKLCESTGWQPRVGPSEGVEALYRWLTGTRAQLEPASA
jgi:CDP-paratose 2-epimerase